MPAAMLRRRFIPPERRSVRSFARSESPVHCRLRVTAAESFSPRSPWKRPNDARFSAGERSGYRAISCDTYPTAALDRGSSGGRPNTFTLPELGRTRPTADRTRVVFPAPLGPRSPRISPGRTESDAPSSARRSPKALTRSRISSGRASATAAESLSSRESCGDRSRIGLHPPQQEGSVRRSIPVVTRRSPRPRRKRRVGGNPTRPGSGSPASSPGSRTSSTSASASCSERARSRCSSRGRSSSGRECSAGIFR